MDKRCFSAGVNRCRDIRKRGQTPLKLSHKLMFQRLKRSDYMGFRRSASLRTWIARLVSETVAGRDAGPEPTRTYLRRVSETSLATHVLDRGTGFVGQQWGLTPYFLTYFTTFKCERASRSDSLSAGSGGSGWSAPCEKIIP